MAMLHDLKGIQEFKEVILEVLAEIFPETRKRIIEGLKARKAAGWISPEAGAPASG
jgi:hypothetical protein